MVLPDALTDNLNIVFCGTAAGNKSAERKAYYTGPGNLFYPTLASCGFIPKLLYPDEFIKLLDYKIGLTDLVKNHYGADKDLLKEHYNITSFNNKILKFQPDIICFNGKEAAKVFFNLKSTREINYGLQLKTIGKTKIFVAPSTSALAKKYWDESIWRELKKLTN
jgi:TDG/mug DNA glycosylase family protein